jgi:hypothetical protein
MVAGYLHFHSKCEVFKLILFLFGCLDLFFLEVDAEVEVFLSIE